MSDAVWVALIGAVATIAAAIVTAWLTRKPGGHGNSKGKDEKPRMDACYGRWTWRADEDAFKLELRADGSFLAKNADGDLWRGTWYVRDGCMFVAQTHYQTEDGWESRNVVWLEDYIAEVSATAIRFKYGGVFERVES